MQPLLRERSKALTPLTLRYLEAMPELNGKGVTALSVEDRTTLWGRELSVIQIPKTAHPDMKYILFARLNQGSMTLNSQELRNCLFRGRYNNLIARLSEDQQFLSLWKKQTPDKRMRDRERVLRFFALTHRRDQYRTPFRAFLNDEMASHRELSGEDEQRYRTELDLAIKWVRRVFDTEAFFAYRMGDSSNPPGRWIRRRHDTLYEVEMVVFAQFGEHLDRIWDAQSTADQQLMRMSLRHRAANVMSNEQFAQTLREGTTRPDVLHRRFDLWSQAIEGVVKDLSPAIASARGIHQRLSQASVCGICPNQVTPDDAVLASVNGDTKLLHRFCSTTLH
jgi:hypothetical protein